MSTAREHWQSFVPKSIIDPTIARQQVTKVSRGGRKQSSAEIVYTAFKRRRFIARRQSGGVDLVPSVSAKDFHQGFSPRIFTKDFHLAAHGPGPPRSADNEKKATPFTNDTHT
jgi:hypothetical protein